MDANTVMEALPVAVARLDARGRVVTVNNAWRALAATQAGGNTVDPIGIDYVALCEVVLSEHVRQSGDTDMAALATRLARILRDRRGTFDFEYASPVRGQDRWFRVEVSALASGGALVVHTDTSRHRRAIARAERRASLDPLTQALNRRGFRQRLKRRLHAKRGGPAGALVLLDLDDFKPVNDRFGHSAGDELLSRVAARLHGALRPDDLVGRFGGDEFVVFASDVTTPNGLVALMERLRGKVEQPVRIAGSHIIPRTSLGGLVVDPAVTGVDAAIAVADRNMYADKEARRMPVLASARGLGAA